MLSAFAKDTDGEPRDDINARTWIYDDTQVFFTIMVYFPFVANFFDTGISLKRSDDPLQPAAGSAGTDEQVVIPDSIDESDYPNSTARAEETTGIRSRQKRFLFEQDEQPINIFLCVSLPFSVPILTYDDRLTKKWKPRPARNKMGHKRPELQPSEDDFVQTDPDGEDDEDFFEDDEAEED